MNTLKNKTIKDILKRGSSFKTDNLIVIYLENDLGNPRFAFVISRRFSKKAVDRNRAKRIIREAIRLNSEKLKDLSYDIVLVPKREILGKKVWQLEKDITQILKFLKKR